MLHMDHRTSRASLTRFAWLSITAAAVTIGLKFGAYALTGSVGLLSDAFESVVNLVAAVVALVALTVAARPPDADHAYGHDKAEYFASGVEGGLILIAALSIIYVATVRLFDPQPIEQPGLGLVVAVVASAINLVVARILLQAGRHYRSITLEADAHHLMTDVWTSVGVVLGVAAVALTGWQRLDPIIAMIVAANIIWSGARIIRSSALGLLDTALSVEDRARVEQILAGFCQREGVQYHALRTRQSAARRFVSVHILVPGDWTVAHGHLLLEQIEAEVRRVLPGSSVFTHLEPLDDPLSFEDESLDRPEQQEAAR
jgi:cation diffusion facilitator family transporter